MQEENDRPVILYLCDYQAPYGGNFIASMARLYGALRAQNADGLFLFPTGAKERPWCEALAAQGPRVLFFDKGAPFYKRLALLLSIIDETHATLLHVHFGCFPVAELAALLRPKLRLILHFHSDFSAGKKPTVLGRIREKAKGLPEWLIGKKRLTKITVSETSAMTTPDCIPLHNALVSERFTLERWDRAETRLAHNVPETATLVLAFGWSPYIKGVDVAARAMARLFTDGHTEYVLGLVCGREYPPERMRAFLRQEAGCTGNEPWLRLLPPIEDVFRYHKASDVFLSASRSETFSYALLEALYAEKPCVCSDIPGVRWAERFDTVGFFPSGDAAALAEALLAAAGDGGTGGFAARAQTARETVEREYAIEDWCAGLLSIYGLDAPPFKRN